MKKRGPDASADESSQPRNSRGLPTTKPDVPVSSAPNPPPPLHGPKARQNAFADSHPCLSNPLQNFLQLLLLLRRQAGGKLDLDAHDKVAPLAGLLALRHAEAGEPFGPGWSGGPTAADRELLAVDGLYGAAPAGERFFEVQFDDVFDVVAFAGEEGVFFLIKLLASIQLPSTIKQGGGNMSLPPAR